MIARRVRQDAGCALGAMTWRLGLCTLMLLQCVQATAQAVPTDDWLTIVAAGDTMLGSDWPDPAELPPGGGKSVLANVAPILRGADIAFVNLEGVIGGEDRDVKRCSRPEWCFAFRMPIAFAAELADAGISIVSSANNHSGDFGPNGRASTARALSSAGVRFAGPLESPTAVLERRGLRVGFIAFAPNMGVLDFRDTAAAAAKISALRADVDIVVVSVHAGAEGPEHLHVPRKDELYVGENRGNVHAFAHAAVDAGADLVVGHGPHVPRGMEIYKSRLIAYSLGNFATYGRFNLRGVSGYAPLLEVRLNRNGEFAHGRIISAIQEKGVAPRIDTEARAFALMRDLSRQDFEGNAPEFNDDGTFGPSQTGVPR